MANYHFVRTDRACQHCGKTPIIGYKFCSIRCGDLHRGKIKGVGIKRRPEQVCKNCGKTFRPKSADKITFCSRECCFEYRRVNAADNVCAVYFRQCSVCAKEFATRSMRARLCSEECRKAEARIAARVTVLRACAWCGTKYETSYTGGGPRRFCSDNCKEAAKRRYRAIFRKARKARQRGATTEAVDPLKVFERDGWRCQFCKIRTPKRLRGTYADNAPELDHIIPLSKGGAHSYANTQCLCRKCNGIKSGTEKGQLLLFGGAM